MLYVVVLELLSFFSYLAVELSLISKILLLCIADMQAVPFFMSLMLLYNCSLLFFNVLSTAKLLKKVACSSKTQ